MVYYYSVLSPPFFSRNEIAQNTTDQAQSNMEPKKTAGFYCHGEAKNCI